MNKFNLHKKFKLNEFSFSSEEELLLYSKKHQINIYEFLKDWFNKNDYVVVKTSGSTGKPKPIKLLKKSMINSALATGTFFDLKENTTALLCMSVDYIAGKMMLVRALVLGWQLDVVLPTSKININKEYDFSAMVPLQLRNSLSTISKVKKLIVGGGVVANDLKEAIQNISTNVYATYGMTETITHIAVKKLNNYTNTTLNYKVLPNVNITTDARGCLVINAPKLSSEEIVTNDVVTLTSNSSFIWLGRYDNVINSGGIKLHPEEIEEKLSSIIIQRFFVIGVKDDVLGEKLVLMVEGKHQNYNLSEIKNLSKYEIPKEIYFVDKFVETATQKIQRNKTLLKVLPK